MSTETDLAAARDAGLLTDEQFSAITNFLNARAERAGQAPPPKFDLTHVLWYAGALLVIGAMGLFTTEAFNRMGGWALFWTGAIYAVVLWIAGHHLWQSRNLKIPGGLLIAGAVSMVPMMIYGVQDAMNFWRYAAGDPGSYHDFFDYVRGSWIFMETGAIAAAGIAIWFYRFPFILLIAAVALWFMSMDLAMWFTHTPTDYYDFETRQTVSVIFGLAMIFVALALDICRKNGPDFAFWLHIFGALTLWGGLTFHDGGTELQKFIYCLICLALVGLGIFLGRRVYAVLGTLGVATYLGYLAYDVFKDVIAFSFVLSAIGVAVIGLGLLLNRHRTAMSAYVDAAIPAGLKWLRPVHP